ncbi:MAG: LysR family transcriptional regulator [Oceanospirillaceae bacterium]
MFLLPSIKALKIFECACRHSSFSLAAEELNLSPGAVSQHIKNLEIRVGFDVFERSGRGVIVTPSGERLLVSIKQGLNGIQRSIDIERTMQNSNDLIINALPGFSIRWLYPRLMIFNQRFPKINICVNAVENPIDFNANHAHAGISYGADDTRFKPHSALFSEELSVEKLAGEELFSDKLFPVCSPSFAQQHSIVAPVKRGDLKALLDYPIVIDQSPLLTQYSSNWDYWLKQLDINVAASVLKRAQQYRISNISLQLAELGHGIAMGRTSLVMDAIEQGSLIALTDVPVSAPLVCQLVENTAIQTSNAVQCFDQWLRESCQAVTEYNPIY